MTGRSHNALQVAVELAERQRDGARQLLRDARATQAAADEQMAQLQAYANETDARWGMHAGARVAPEVMFHHRHFMGRLEHAMGMQSNVLADHGQRVASAEAALLAAELRVATLNKLVAKRQHEAAAAQTRREQKQTDEQAALALRLRTLAY